MHEWLKIIAEQTVGIINAMAMLTIAFGTFQAFLRIVRAMFAGEPAGSLFHVIYIGYAHWLVGGLTFQLAADIIDTAFSPSWDEIGRLAAIAAIRTFLNFFLERDLEQQEKRAAQSQAEQSVAGAS